MSWSPGTRMAINTTTRATIKIRSAIPLPAGVISLVWLRWRVGIIDRITYGALLHFKRRLWIFPYRGCPPEASNEATTASCWGYDYLCRNTSEEVRDVKLPGRG